MEIKLVSDTTIKRDIAAKILRDLPEWFGIEDSTNEYIKSVVQYDFIAAYIGEEIVGFYSVREENKKVLDLYVLGVLKQYHKQGIGSKLQEFVNSYAKDNGYQYLMVLTLAEKAQNKEYLITRNFYLSQGFHDFYQNDDIFDSHNPCQIMIKKI